uniref:Reverse transcriptase (RNA-dependent DNA polymerase) n=2 Tax=Candidatus Kentrum sp. UNK TaxID=2126344 RepID=A0A451B6T4_9GAMM|nr:MAG: hypothetical protein BECKUNK1418H_GA0071006_13741 [Candidatus Kentron sp. UNK]
MGLKCKIHSLTGRITPKLMREAFKNVKRNRGAAGIDKVSVQMFEAPINKIPDENLDALMRNLKTRGKFMPKPLRRVVIPKDKENMLALRAKAERGGRLRYPHRFFLVRYLENLRQNDQEISRKY